MKKNIIVPFPKEIQKMSFDNFVKKIIDFTKTENKGTDKKR